MREPENTAEPAAAKQPEKEQNAEIKIRPASLQDCGRIAEIYAYYVENTAISFEYDAPGADEIRARMKRISAAYPYLTAEQGGWVIGYAYASPLKEREAYSRAVETSIYVDYGWKKSGAGRALYSALEEILRSQGILNMYACIAYSQEEDEYLTGESVMFHKKMGFSQAGVFHKCGYKFDRWYDVMWMEKHIGSHG